MFVSQIARDHKSIKFHNICVFKPSLHCSASVQVNIFSHMARLSHAQTYLRAITITNMNICVTHKTVTAVLDNLSLHT